MKNSDKRQNVNPARLYERQAISIVKDWVGLRGTLRDTSSGNGPDFEIEYIDGRKAIGEVSTHIDPVTAAAWSAVRKKG